MSDMTRAMEGMVAMRHALEKAIDYVGRLEKENDRLLETLVEADDELVEYYRREHPEADRYPDERRKLERAIASSPARIALAERGEWAAAEAAEPAEADGERGWSEAMERAIADAIEIAAVRGADDEDMAYRIARAVIAVDRAERPPIQPVQAVPISECPSEWRDGRWLLVCDATGTWGVRYWHPGLEKWIGMPPQLPESNATYVAPLPSTRPVPPVLPPGWVAVPREPTEAMLANTDDVYFAGPQEVWAAIIAAVPPCPGVKEGKGDE